MADDVRIDSLSIEIESNVKPAAQSINSLASAVKKFNDEVAKGKGFGEIVNLANSAKTAADNMKDAPARLRELADALRVLGQASKGVKFSKELAATLSDIGVAAKNISANVGQRLNSLAAGLTALRDVGDVRISPTIGSGIASINEAVANINVNNLSRIGRFVEELRPLQELGNLTISNSIGQELVNIANAAEVIRDVDFTPIRQLSTALGYLAMVDDVRLPHRLADDIINLGVAALDVQDVDWSVFERMAAGLRHLEGLGEIRVPRIRGAANNNDTGNGANNQGLDAVEDGIGGISRQANNASASVEQLSGNMDNLESSSENVIEALATMARQFSHGFANATGLTNVIRQMREIFSSPANAIGYGVGVAVNTLISAVSRLGSALKSVSVKAFTLALNGLQTALHGVASAAKSAASALVSFGKLGGQALAAVAKIEFKGLMALPTMFASSLGKKISDITSKIKGFVRSLGRVAFYRAIRSAIKEITKAFSEGIKNLYQWSKQINGTFAQSMDKIATSLLYLKNSIGAAVSPILEALAPVLEQVVDKVVEVINRINQLFSALSGKTTYTAAKKISTEWAEAAKEAKKTILGFDEINQLQKDTRKDKQDYGSMFETRTIDSDIASFAKKIREFFQNGEWAQLGKLLADQINTWIDSIDWPAIGEKIANGLNALAKTFNSFMENIDWIKIGRSLTEALNKLVEDVDWEEIGRMFSQKFNALSGILLGFAENFKWGEAGVAFADAVWGLIDGIKWEQLGTAIGDSISGLATSVYNAALNFPWGKAGEKLASGANALFSSISWTKIADGITKFFEGALDSLKTFIAKFNWKEHGEELRKGIMKLVSQFPVTDAAKVITGGIQGALRMAMPTLKDTELMKELGGKLAEFLNGIFDNSNGWWDTVGEAANDLIVDVLTIGQQFVKDFDEIQAASSIKAALEKIHWNEIATKTWNLISSALSKAGNFANALFWDNSRVIDTAGVGTSWVDRVLPDSNSLGTRIADSLKKVIMAVPWESIAKTTWDYVKKGFKIAYDFVSAMFGLDEKTAADTNAKIKKIGEKIGGELQKIPWASIASDVWGKIKTAFSYAGNFVDALLNYDTSTALTNFDERAMREFNKQSFGYKLGDRISKEIAKIDWKQFGTDLSTGASNLLKNFSDALNQLTKRNDATHRSPLEDTLIKFFEGIDKEQLAESLKGTLTAIAKVIVQTFQTVLNEAFNTLLSDPSNYVNGYSDSSFAADPTMGAGSSIGMNRNQNGDSGSSNWFFGKGKKLADSLVSGTTGELNAKQTILSDAFKDAFVDPYMVEVEGTNGFDVGSPSKRTEKLGTNVMQGFLNGIKPMWQQFTTAASQNVQNLVTLVLQPLNNLVTIGIPTNLTTATTAFQTGWNNIQITTSTGVQGVVTLTLTALKNVADVGIPNQFKAFNSGFETGWSDINITTNKAMGNFYSIIRGYMDSLSSYLPSKFKSIFNEIVGYTNSLINRVESACNSVINGLNSALTIHLEWTKPDWAGGGTYWWNWNANMPNVDFSNVSYLANGGILRSPTWLTPNAIGGEAGYEAVLPLDTHTEWMNDIADRVVAAANNSYYASGAGEREGSGYDNSREIALIERLLDEVRAIKNKDTTVEITTGQIARANVRQNRRAGTTIIPVGT